MSKLDFLPRHCESDNFRGFSFIGDNFPIPQRNKSEEDHYWNNVDDDGQSLSECASSVFDDDLKEATLPEPEPAKKKRPPRKKKKKEQTIPLETTNEAYEKNSETASQTEAEISDNKPEFTEASLETNNNHSASTDKEKSSIVIVQKEVVNKSLLDDKESSKAVDINPPQARLDVTISPNVTNLTAPTSLNPAAKSWQVPNTQDNKPSLAAPEAEKSTTMPVYTPKPGTWASLAVGKGKLNQTHSTVSAARAPVAQGRATSPEKRPNKLSQDWRSHVMSPKMNSDIAPPSPLSPNSAQIAWPSLGDFPPPPGAKTTLKQQSKSLGAWGKAV